MIKHIFLMFLISILSISQALAAPNILQDPARRNLVVTRHYEITVQKGKPSVAEVPALMSFWGSTNWQVVKSSKFEYSEEPNNVAVTSDNLGMPRRYYKLTWNAPKSDKITVEQKMDVQLAYFNNLYTTAKLPYSEDVKKRFADSLKADIKEGIDPNNHELGPICEQIVNNSSDAENVVEGVCDWINENIKFEKGERTSNEVLTQRKGSCTPMSRLACAMLRKIGIPAETVDAKFIDSGNGHTFIEAYFPDAGWVFYDLSNWNRGFKSLDCLETVGWSYKSGMPGKMTWTDGYFCTEKDTSPFVDQSMNAVKHNKRTPQRKANYNNNSNSGESNNNIVGVRHIRAELPPIVKPRQIPLRELIMDLTVPPGPRDYNDNVIK
ncbi:MAG: transglutaminase domain-containing protein [Sedimentisphaerales bacterium]|jgi:hypothetical protein